MPAHALHPGTSGLRHPGLDLSWWDGGGAVSRSPPFFARLQLRRRVGGRAIRHSARGVRARRTVLHADSRGRLPGVFRARTLHRVASSPRTRPRRQSARDRVGITFGGRIGVAQLPRRSRDRSRFSDQHASRSANRAGNNCARPERRAEHRHRRACTWQPAQARAEVVSGGHGGAGRRRFAHCGIPSRCRDAPICAGVLCGFVSVHRCLGLAARCTRERIAEGSSRDDLREGCDLSLDFGVERLETVGPAR